MTMTEEYSYLDIFDLYVSELDDKFDDNIEVYYDFDESSRRPVFDITYCSCVDLEELEQNIPHTWKQLEYSQKIIINLHPEQSDIDSPFGEHIHELKSSMSDLLEKLGKIRVIRNNSDPQ